MSNRRTSQSGVAEELKARVMFQLSQLDPRILKALEDQLSSTAAEVVISALRTRNDVQDVAVGEDPRVVQALQTRVLFLRVMTSGKERSAGGSGAKYSFGLMEPGVVGQVLADDNVKFSCYHGSDLEVLLQRMRPINELVAAAPPGTLPVFHVSLVVGLIARLVADKSVGAFMVGKASHKKDAKSAHIHMGMVNRFGNKYKGSDYTRMIGVAFLDGEQFPAAESYVLMLESRLHALFSDPTRRTLCQEKFDSISNKMSGKLVDGPPSNYYFTLYVALKPVEENEGEEEEEEVIQ